MVSKFTQPDITAQDENTWLGGVDDAIAVHHRLSGMFSIHAQETPDLTVRIDAGHILNPISQTLIEVAAQDTAALTAPTGNPRHDIVYVDRLTGAAGVAAGSEASSPADPDIPAGKAPLGRIAWTVGMTEITDADLTDLRNLAALGFSFDGTAGAILLTDGDGSSLTGLTIGDPTARDMAILNAFDISELLGRSISALGAAVVDAFEDDTGIDGTASTGEVYDASGDYYSNRVDSDRLEIVNSPTGSNTIDWTQAPRPYIGFRFTAPAAESVVAAAIEIQSVGVAGTAVCNIYAHGNATPLGTSESVAVSGAGRIEALFASPVSLSNGGDYVIEWVLSGASAVAKPKTNTTGGSGVAYRGRLDGSSIYNSTTEANIDGGEYFQIGYVGAAIDDLSLVSIAATAASDPSTARITLDHEDVGGSAVLNTDVTVEASRDDGATWTAGTLALLRDAGGGRKVYTADVDLSAQPSGTDLRWRGKQLNGSTGRWHRWAVQADVLLSV